MFFSSQEIFEAMLHDPTERSSQVMRKGIELTLMGLGGRARQSQRSALFMRELILDISPHSITLCGACSLH